MARPSVAGANAAGLVRSIARRVNGWANAHLGTAIAIAIILVAWEAVTRLVVRNDAYLPSASFSYRQSLAYSDALVAGVQQTFTGVLLAIPIAVVIGIVVGILFAESFIARQVSMPVLVFSYAIPHAILAPMFLLWFGLGTRGIVAFAIWIAFFPTFINTLTSMSTVDPELEMLADVVGATRWQRVRYLTFWRALPDIISGIRISVQMAIIGVIVAEFLAGGNGLGHLIEQATYRGRLGLTFGAVITIGVGAIVLFKGVSLVLSRIDPSQRGTDETPGQG